MGLGDGTLVILDNFDNNTDGNDLIDLLAIFISQYEIIINTLNNIQITLTLSGIFLVPIVDAKRLNTPKAKTSNNLALINIFVPSAIFIPLSAFNNTGIERSPALTGIMYDIKPCNVDVLTASGHNLTPWQDIVRILRDRNK